MFSSITKHTLIVFVTLCLFTKTLQANDVYATEHLFRGIEIQANLDDSNHSCHIYRGETNVFQNASLIAQDIASGTIHEDDQARADRSYFYWAVNTLDISLNSPIGPAEGTRSLTNIDFNKWDITSRGTYFDGEAWDTDIQLGVPVYGNGAWLIPCISWDDPGDLQNTTYYLRSTDDGLTWSKVDLPIYSGTNRDKFRSVVYGNGIWMAEGHNRIHYSSDGLNWSQTSNSHRGRLVYGDGKFMVIGSRMGGASGLRSFTTTDAISWTDGGSVASPVNPAGIEYFSDFIYGNGTFLYVYRSEKTLQQTSDNGATWTSVTLPTDSSNFQAHIVFTNGKFIFNHPTSYTGTNHIEYDYNLYTSTNGLTWHLTTHDWLGLGFKSVHTENATGANNLFWASQHGSLHNSSDGISWSQVSRDSFLKVAYGNNIYLATGSEGYISRSTDGTTWTGVNGLTNRWFKDVAISGQNAVAVGQYGLVAKSSDAGKSWTLVEGLFPNPSGGLINDYDALNVEIDNGSFVVVADRVELLPQQGATTTINGNPYTHDDHRDDFLTITSNDGDNWSTPVVFSSRRSVNGSGMLPDSDGLRIANGQMLMANIDDLWHSPNGSTWTEANNSFQISNRRGVIYHNGNYYWHGYAGSFVYDNYVYSTTDPSLRNWASVSGWPGTSYLSDLKLIDGNFIYREFAYPLPTVTWSSPDLITWTPINFVPGSRITKHGDVQIGHSRQSAEQNLTNYEYSKFIYTSTDGIHYSTDNKPDMKVLDDTDPATFLGVERSRIYRAGLPEVSPPSITALPAVTSVLLNEKITLTIQASGDPVLEYKWFQGATGDETNPIGTDNPSVTLTSVNADTQIWVRILNEFGSTDSDTVNVTVILPIPELTSSNTLNGNAGKPVLFQVTATHTPDFFGATGLPSGIIIDQTTGIISGFPSQSGSFPVTLTIKNGIYEGTANITLNLAPPAPVIVSSASMTAQIGSPFQYQIAASGAPTSYASSALPAGLSINTSSGLISGTPTATGQFTIDLSATSSNGSGNLTLVLNISPSPNRPQINSPLFAVTRVSQPFSYLITHLKTATTYSAVNLPTGLSINPGSGSISGIVSTVGTYPVTIGVENASGERDEQTLHLYIGPPENTPQVTSVSETQVHSGASIDFTFAATDSPTGFSISQTSGTPNGFWSFNSNTGQLTGTAPQVGTYTFSVIGQNANGSGAPQVWTLRVIAPLNAPVVTDPSQLEATQGSFYTKQLTATNGGNTFVTQGALPTGITLDSSGLISGTPSVFGLFTFKVKSTDGILDGPCRDIEILVQPSSNLDEITPLPSQNLVAGNAFLLNLEVPETVSSLLISGLPPGILYEPTTHQLYGTPTSIGQFTATIAAVNTSGTGPVTEISFQVDSPFNRPQVISSAKAFGQVGSAFNYPINHQLQAGDTFLGYQVSNLPRGLAYDSASLKITGSPIVAGRRDVTITVISSYGSSEPFQLSIEISNASSLPAVSNKASVVAQTGSPFGFQIGSTKSPVLAYGADNLPPGLTLDRFSGVISGIPTKSGQFISLISVATSAGTSPPLELCFHIKAGITAPKVATTLSLVGYEGDEVTRQIFATGLPPHGVGNPLPDGFQYHANGLPEGLSLDTQTGIISGILIHDGEYRPTIWASNSAGPGEQRSGYVTIRNPYSIAPQMIGPSHIVMQQNDVIMFQTIARNVGSHYRLYASHGVIEGQNLSNTTGNFSIKALKTGTQNVTVNGFTRRSYTTYYRSRYRYSRIRWYSDALRLRVDVLPNANSPQMTTPRRVEAIAGTAFNLTLSAAPAATSYRLGPGSRIPPGLVFDGIQGKVLGTPTAPGVYPLTVIPRNASGDGYARETELAVYAEASAPTITSIQPGAPSASPLEAPPSNTGQNISPNIQLQALASTYTPAPDILPTVLEITAGELADWQISATGGATRYSAEGLPAGILINPHMGSISGIANQPGNYPVSLQGLNASTVGNSIHVILRVLAKEGTPELLSLTPLNGQVGAAFSHQLITSNSANTFQVTGLPSGLSLDTASGLISGIPAQVGEFELTLWASNSIGDGFPVTNRLTIYATAGTPNITGSTAHALQVGQSWQYTIPTDIAADTFTASDLPAGLGLNPDTGELSGTPLEPGIYKISLCAINHTGTGNCTQFTLTVNGLNNSPTMDSQSVFVVDSAVTQTYQLSATGAASYNVDDLPDGFRLDATTGSISISQAPRGLYTFVTSANNGTGVGNPSLHTLRIGTAYDLWASTIFGSTDVLDETQRSTRWGKLADPDGDQILNIFENYHNSNPLLTDPLNATIIPGTITPQNKYTFRWKRSKTATNGEPVYQWSIDMDTWYDSGTGPSGDVRNINAAIETDHGNSETLSATIDRGLEKTIFLRLKSP